MSVGHPRVRSAILLGGAVLTVVLIVALVPRYGGEGAAVASLLTYTAIALASVVFFSRITGVPVRECLVLQRGDLRRGRG
jgi:O-antigen/teichoic acid export membrane protein